MSDRLKDKVAIVVGAGQTPGDTIGNGRATAMLFAREGARVLLVDRRLESARETQALIEAAGGTCSAFAADVVDRAACQAMAQACVDTYGQIDVLQNNVGIAEGDRNVLKLAEADWDRIMDVNLKGMYLTCQAVLPHMVARERGSIINISSAAAVCAVNMVAYKVSKAGVNALTHAVAMGAARKGVRVNAIMPGMIHTPMGVGDFMQKTGMSEQEVIAWRNEHVPLKGGQGDAWDVAQASLFLASDEAKFITGIVLPVDGGQTARIG